MTLTSTAQVASAFLNAKSAKARSQILTDLNVRIAGKQDADGNWLVRPNKRKAWRDLAAAMKDNDKLLISAFAESKTKARDLRVKRKDAAARAEANIKAEAKKRTTKRTAKPDTQASADPAATLAAALSAMPKEDRAAAFFAALKTLV